MIKRIAITVLLLASFSASAFNRALIHKASFDETYNRYPTPYSIIQEFHQIAPYAEPSNSCFQLQKNSAPVLGTIDPMRGEALEKVPGDLFFQYYSACVHSLTTSGFQMNGVSAAKTIFGSHYDELVNRRSGELDLIFWSNDDWLSASGEFQYAFLNYAIDYLVGPDEVLQSQGYLGDKTAFGIKIKDRAELIGFLITQMNRLAEGSTVFKMQDVYADLAIILRLGPALRG